LNLLLFWKNIFLSFCSIFISDYIYPNHFIFAHLNNKIYSHKTSVNLFCSACKCKDWNPAGIIDTFFPLTLTKTTKEKYGDISTAFDKRKKILRLYVNCIRTDVIAYTSYAGRNRKRKYCVNKRWSKYIHVQWSDKE
jgi:hypothetical protein